MLFPTISEDGREGGMVVAGARVGTRSRPSMFVLLLVVVVAMRRAAISSAPAACGAIST